MSIAGILLAAGAGRRMGLAKGLLRDVDNVPFVVRAVGVLFEGGCETVTVVVGAEADRVTILLDEAGWTSDPDVEVVVAEDWDEGMGASLRRGLAHAVSGEHDVALVSLVDLPDVDATVVRRVLDAAPSGRGALARATYHGEPGHPVLLGRDHWQAVLDSAQGDRGARDYLLAQDVTDIDCADLATGRDVDLPHDL
jgi:CTP:molybdopterin cytidylyltransferase MocA